ncbi:hypothetical protein [Thalassobaculum salexigens]|uniref:hypothetical protein n=1 Tax=Thalassobaculum salexigens TaxID=455360 RepID=UPI00248D5A89|nr:hypothetical protein [Thalassobaculum salexigens]
MALSAITLAWLDHLAEYQIIPPGPVLEFGPQHINAARPVVSEFLTRRTGEQAAQDAMERIYGTPAAPRPQTEVYRALGLDDYLAVDFGDELAEVQHDLNEPLDLGRKFSAVTNFGTAEHIFEVATVLRSQYRHLAVGGVALLVLPTFGEINHGFYNLHPTLWTDLAVANNMEIGDFQYVDDVVGRSVKLDEQGTCQFDFDSMPIKPLEGQYGNFRLTVAINFLRNTGLHMQAAAPGQLPQYVLDCCMVALRRTADSPDELRVPPQAIYAPPETRAAVAAIRTVR